MTLQEFVRQSLLDISTAVREAHASDSSVAPLVKSSMGSEKSLIDYQGIKVSSVEFDVAVTASREAGLSGSAKVGIISVISSGADASLSTEHTTVSRLKFAVPISYYPQQYS